jgi:hypothetical protein
MARNDSVGKGVVDESVPPWPAVSSPAEPSAAPALPLLGAPPSCAPSPPWLESPAVMRRGCSDEVSSQPALAESMVQALTTSAPRKLAARTAKVRQHSTHKNANGGAAIAIAVAAVSFVRSFTRADRAQR